MPALHLVIETMLIAWMLRGVYICIHFHCQKHVERLVCQIVAGIGNLKRTDSLVFLTSSFGYSMFTGPAVQVGVCTSRIDAFYTA